MRDDFDKDNPSSGDEEDFSDFDWLADSDQDAPKTGNQGRLGVTGDLPWLGEDKPTEETQPDEIDDAFDWLLDPDDKTASPSDSSRLGVTGQLSWLGTNEEEEETASPDNPRLGVTGQLDWRKSSFEDQLEAAEQAAGVDWGKDALDPSTYEVEEEEDDALPDWLQGADDDSSLELDEEFSEPTSRGGLASWLTSDDDQETVDEPPAWDDDVMETGDAFADLFADTEIETTRQQAVPSTDDFDLFSELTSGNEPTGLTGLLNPDVVSEEEDFDLLGTLESSANPPQIADDNFFEDLLGDYDTADEEADVQEGDIEDIDAFLAALGSSSSLVPVDDDELTPLADAGDIDFDSLFEDTAFTQLDSRPEATELPDTPAPDFLSGVTISENSAAALVRKQQDRPLEDLSDRLLALREESMSLPSVAPTETDRSLSELFPDPKDVLPAIQVDVRSEKISDRIALTPAQSSKVALLTSLTSASAAAAEVALDQVPVTAAQRRRLGIKFDRILITLLVGLAVMLPFFGILKIGELPPTRFTLGTRQQAAFDLVNNLAPDQLVLFAAEYGSTTAGELDDSTDALLRHVLLRGAHPVIVSSNPIGLLRADNRITALAGTTLARNRDYYVGRYLAGETVGLRAFSQDINTLTRLDVQGNPTGLTINSLDNFALIIVITENFESVRAWSEQVDPITRTPLVFATSYSASPLASAYTNALIVGYRDAYTYNNLIDTLIAGGDISPLNPLIPTRPVSPTPTEAIEPTEESDLTATSEVDGIATEEATQAESTEATDTGSTDAPSTTPTSEATDTPEPTATATSTPTETPTQTPEPEVFALIVASQAVNIREGPGRDFAPIGVVQPDTRVQVLDESEDGEWTQIRLDDGIEGWVSSALIEIEEPEASLPSLNLGFSVRVGWGAALPQVNQQPEPTPIAQTEVNLSRPYRDERWYGMTTGIIAIVLVIFIGNVMSLIRRAMRNRRKV